MELSNDIKVLKDLVTVLLAKIEALESENAALRAENAELRSRLNLNSKNSHKPLYTPPRKQPQESRKRIIFPLLNRVLCVRVKSVTPSDWTYWLNGMPAPV